MGLLDKLKGTASSVLKTADKALDQHGDKLAAGVDAAGGAVKKATKGKYADTVDKGVDLAKKPLTKSSTTGGTSVTLGADEPVVSADPVSPADPATPTGNVVSDDPGDATSATGSESDKP
jgi:hypothetical protein